MHPGFHQFQKLATNPVSFRAFLLKNLPAAFFAGLRIETMDETSCVVSVRYGWFNRNPFRSMYFAIESMAAELSTGALAMAQVYRRQPALSLLVTGIEARFTRKAVGRIRFHCNDGAAIEAAAHEAIESGEPVSVDCVSTGIDEQGETVAEFRIVWRFKKKTKV